MMCVVPHHTMKHLPLFALAFALAACVQVTTTDDDESASSATQVQVEWQSVQTGTGAYDMPLMQLSLVDSVEGTVYFRTDCEGTISPEKVVEENLLAMLCWWAGGGERFTVVKQGDTLTVRNQQVDEESGYGEWIDVETVEL